MCEGGYLGQVYTCAYCNSQLRQGSHHEATSLQVSSKQLQRGGDPFLFAQSLVLLHALHHQTTAWKLAADVRALAVEACMLCLLAFITKYLSHEAVFVVKLLLLTAMHPRTSAKIRQLLSAVPVMYEWHGGRIAWAWPFYSLHVLTNCLCKQHVASIWSVLSKKLMLSLATLGYSMLVFFSHHSWVLFMLWWAISRNRCWLCSKKEPFWCVPVP